jgi:hypothetical protein
LLYINIKRNSPFPVIKKFEVPLVIGLHGKPTRRKKPITEVNGFIAEKK